MWTALALFLWIGGLMLLGWSPMIGGTMMAGGAVASVSAQNAYDDLEAFFGTMLFLMIIAALALGVREVAERVLS